MEKGFGNENTSVVMIVFPASEYRLENRST